MPVENFTPGLQITDAHTCFKFLPTLHEHTATKVAPQGYY